MKGKLKKMENWIVNNSDEIIVSSLIVAGSVATSCIAYIIGYHNGCTDNNKIINDGFDAVFKTDPSLKEHFIKASAETIKRIYMEND